MSIHNICFHGENEKNISTFQLKQVTFLRLFYHIFLLLLTTKYNPALNFILFHNLPLKKYKMRKYVSKNRIFRLVEYKKSFRSSITRDKNRSSVATLTETDQGHDRHWKYRHCKPEQNKTTRRFSVGQAKETYSNTYPLGLYKGQDRNCFRNVACRRAVNPFMPSGLFYLNALDQFISN